MSETLLTVEGLRKAYPGVVANDNVSFSIAPGEVHALLGENGAGKSTLVKMIYGLVRPDAGRMTFKGAVFEPATPHAARAAGVAMVFQHFSLFEALNVAENVALGMENPPKQRQLARRIREVSETYGLPLDPDRLVGDLSAGERQRVEIIRCLLQDPRLLIMDEPTSVLTPQEVDILFETLRKLQSEGTAILYISPQAGRDQDAVRQRDDPAAGQGGGHLQPQGKLGPRDGRDDGRPVAAHTVAGSQGTGRGGAGSGGAVGQIGQPVRHLAEGGALEVRSGEVLGIGGVAGNGQDELLAALSGEMLAPPDAVKLCGQDIGHLGPNARRRLGLLTAPEERLGHAAAPDMSLTENALLTGAIREELVSGGFLKWPRRTGVRREDHQGFRRAHAGTGQRGAGAVGRQPAEIRHRARDFAAPRLSGGEPADLGRRCRPPPPQIRQALLDLAAEGCAVIVHQPGSGRVDGNLRPLCGVERRTAERAAPGQGADGGRDRPDDGRRA